MLLYHKPSGEPTPGLPRAGFSARGSSSGGGGLEAGVGAQDSEQAGLLLLLFFVQSSEALTEGKQLPFTQLSLNTGK